MPSSSFFTKPSNSSFLPSILFQKVFVVVAVLLNDIFTKYFGKNEPCFLFLHLHHKAITALLTDTAENLSFLPRMFS